MLSSIYYSFTNYNLLNEPKFIGLDNYRRMFFNDPTFWKSFGDILLCFRTVPLRLVFALFIAMLLNNKMKFVGIYRALYYIPSIVGGSAAISMYGDSYLKSWCNYVLLSFRIHQEIFIGNPYTAF